MRFDWPKNLHLEDKNKRTHITKDFAHPTDPTKRIKIQSSGLLHYFDKEFKDIVDLPFPEGKEITREAERHFMMTLPEWGDAKLEENGRQVRIYDKLGQPIYIFKNPLVIEKGKSAYKVVKDGIKIRETKDRQEILELDERIEKSERIEKNDDALIVDFEVENNKLYFKLPKGLNYPLEAYDDTDTSSTNNKDTYLYSDPPTDNHGDKVVIGVQSDASGDLRRTLIYFTLSSGSGTISAVKLYLYKYSDADGWTCPAVELHELTQTAWVELEATWNIYSTGNDWITPGGDYSATIVDKTNNPIAQGSYGWEDWDLGPGATNPISGLTWESEIHLLLNDTLTGTSLYRLWYSKENASNKPYLEITYTPLTQKSVFDSGLGADAVSVKAKIGISESGQGQDNIIVGLSKKILDIGSGADEVSVKPTIKVEDQGQAQDLISLIKAKVSVSDVGSGVENVLVKVKAFITDVGSGIETISKKFKIFIQEIGKGIDRIKVPPFYSDKYSKQGDSYQDKYSKKGTTYQDKYF